MNYSWSLSIRINHTHTYPGHKLLSLSGDSRVSIRSALLGHWRSRTRLKLCGLKIVFSEKSVLHFISESRSQSLVGVERFVVPCHVQAVVQFFISSKINILIWNNNLELVMLSSGSKMYTYIGLIFHQVLSKVLIPWCHYA